ncbi:hypothetical protein O5171_14635 [Escherichia coli]|nr:hypothetical protein [Escherichia coli]
MTLDIVMVDDPSPSAAMPDEHELTQLALPLPEQAQLDELEATWRWLEARALQGIAATLNRHGLFTTPEIAHRFSAIVQALSAQAVSPASAAPVATVSDGKRVVNPRR